MKTIVHTVLLKPNTRQIVKIKFDEGPNYLVFYPMQEHHLVINTEKLDVFRVTEGFDLRNYDEVYEHRVSLALFEEPFLPEFLHYIQAWQILAFYIQPKCKEILGGV